MCVTRTARLRRATSGDAMRATGGDCYGASDVERPKGAERRRAELLSPEGVRMASPRRFQEHVGWTGVCAASLSRSPRAGRVIPREDTSPGLRKRLPARGLRICLVVCTVVAGVRRSRPGPSLNLSRPPGRTRNTGHRAKPARHRRQLDRSRRGSAAPTRFAKVGPATPRGHVQSSQDTTRTAGPQG